MQKDAGRVSFRIDFIPQGPAESILLAQVEASRDVPYAKVGACSGAAAVVGGGVSIADNVEMLRAFPGTIFAMNGACSWLAAHGVKSTLVSVDPGEFLNTLLEGVETAILASCVHPSVFTALQGHVTKFDLSEYAEDGVIGGCSTVTRMPALLIKLGYTSITFVGCEASFEDSDHVYYHVGDPEAVIVRVAGVDYTTYPEYLLQSLNLVQLLREWPDVFKEQSGGLLRALLADTADSWEIAAVSAALKDKVEAHSGKQGLYEQPYRGIQ